MQDKSNRITDDTRSSATAEKQRAES